MDKNQKLFPNPVSYWIMCSSNAKGNDKTISSTSKSYERQAEKKKKKECTKENKCYILKLLIYLIAHSIAMFHLID